MDCLRIFKMVCLLVFVFLFGCDAPVEEDDAKVEEDDAKVKLTRSIDNNFRVRVGAKLEEPDIPRVEFEDIEDCANKYVYLYNNCNTTVLTAHERPKDVRDLIPQCLWAMNGVYGNKFPLEKDTRYAFFFNCLEKYPETNEKLCQFELSESRGQFKGCEDALDQAHDKCYRMCEGLPLFQRVQIEKEHGSCSSYCW